MNVVSYLKYFVFENIDKCDFGGLELSVKYKQRWCDYCYYLCIICKKVYDKYDVLGISKNNLCTTVQPHVFARNFFQHIYFVICHEYLYCKSIYCNLHRLLVLGIFHSGLITCIIKVDV